MKKVVSEHLQLCASKDSIRFSIRCQECGEIWHSTSVSLMSGGESSCREVQDALMSRELDAARRLAIQEAMECFNICPICGRLVCDSCFRMCKSVDICCSCAKKLGEQGEAVKNIS